MAFSLTGKFEELVLEDLFKSILGALEYARNLTSVSYLQKWGVLYFGFYLSQVISGTLA
jgi:hypothetical protein